MEFRSPSTVTPVTGGVVSAAGGATTVNPTFFSAATFPALSVARYRTLCVPTSCTITGAV